MSDVDFFRDLSVLTEVRRAQVRDRFGLERELVGDGSFDLRRRLVERELLALNFNDPLMLLLDKIIECDKEYEIAKHKNAGRAASRTMVFLLELSLKYRARVVDLVGARSSDDLIAKVLEYARARV